MYTVKVKHLPRDTKCSLCREKAYGACFVIIDSRVRFCFYCLKNAFNEAKICHECGFPIGENGVCACDHN